MQRPHPAFDNKTGYIICLYYKMTANNSQQAPPEEGKRLSKIPFDVLLKTILFSMIFYVINNDLTHLVLNQFRNIINISVLQTLAFGLIYMTVSIFL